MQFSSALYGASIEDVRDQYVGKTLNEIPTPAFIVNQSIVTRNCERMLHRAQRLRAKFRAHVKTHKTIECTRLQLGKCDWSSCSVNIDGGI